MAGNNGGPVLQPTQTGLGMQIRAIGVITQRVPYNLKPNNKTSHELQNSATRLPNSSDGLIEEDV
jgi:hypothetical protein